MPWLGPDVSDTLTELAQSGSQAAVLVPIGFVSDHMEVVFDLDVQARQTADRLGLPMARAATPGTDPRFVGMIGNLVRELQAAGPRPAAGDQGSGALYFCRENCCGAGPDRSVGVTAAGS